MYEPPSHRLNWRGRSAVQAKQVRQQARLPIQRGGPGVASRAARSRLRPAVLWSN